MTSDTDRDTTSGGLGSVSPIWTMACLCVLGLALRLWYAHWPLWVDEIWSLKDLVPIGHFWQILWGISQDNNHYLYSIYLFFAYPISHNEIWLRAPRSWPAPPRFRSWRNLQGAIESPRSPLPR